MTSSKPRARLIIPLWGEIYADKLVTITLPAILAPGNLPALCESFSVELVLVTETRLFERIKAARSCVAAARCCNVKFVPIDDLLTDSPGEYGVVLTNALFRGFTDLGERMTETYFLFFNADFIISDGSLRHLATRMLRGERVIHAPSFRVVLEDVWPKLETRVDSSGEKLAIPSREMVKLALANKHITVKARTVNQRICHQTWMDQFYWYIDDSTLIGYQLPVALVAIRPEKVVTEPVLVWDYGFTPEAAPNLPRHFIGDSDDFFMIEPQKRLTGESMIRLGWITIDDIAKNLSLWTTKDQRDCGRQLLTIHAGELPAQYDAVVAESKNYLDQVYARLTPNPQPHIGHGWLGPWFNEVHARIKLVREMKRAQQAQETHQTVVSSIVTENGTFNGSGGLSRRITSILRYVYRAGFGELPVVKSVHPLWIDTHEVAERLAKWRIKKANILWLTSGDSFFRVLLDHRIDPAGLLTSESSERASTQQYDGCFCELTFDELVGLKPLYERIRGMVKDGGEIVVWVFNRNARTINQADIALFDKAFPDVDVSELRFHGSRSVSLIRDLFLKASVSFPHRPILRQLISAAVLIGLAPIAKIANSFAAEQNASLFNPQWTSLTLTFNKRGMPRAPDS